MGKETEATTWTTSKFGVTGLSQKREISVTEDDPLPLRTVHAVFEDTCLKYGENLALAQRITLAPPVNPAELDQDAENVATRDLKWRRFTWNEYRDDCRTFAKALVHSDIEPKEVVNILGSNSPQWVIANLGSMLAGCIPAGIYLSNHSESCLQCSNATKSAALIVEAADEKTDLGSSSSEPLASASATTGSTAAVVSPPPQKNTASMTPEASEEWSTGKGEGEGEGAGARLSVVALKEGEKVNTTARSYEAAKSDPAWKRYIDEGIDRHNRLHAASHAQKIQKWAFLPSALTEEAGELTALGKIKRNFVLDKYAGLINDLYREEESSNTQMSGSTSCPAVVVTPTRK